MENTNIAKDQLLKDVDVLKKKAIDLKSFYESIVATATDATVTIEENVIIASWNAAACTMFGYNSLEIVNTKFTKLFSNKYFNINREVSLKKWLKVCCEIKLAKLQNCWLKAKLDCTLKKNMLLPSTG